MFRKNPDLLDFKKKNYVDPDKLAAERAPKKIPLNKKVSDKNGYTYGLYKRFDWEHPQL